MLLLLPNTDLKVEKMKKEKKKVTYIYIIASFFIWSMKKMYKDDKS